MLKSKNQEVIKKYLTDFPNTANRSLAQKIYNENKLLFKDAEAVRRVIRYYRGSSGKDNLQQVDDKFLLPENINKKYNLPEPIKVEEYTPYIITGNHGLIFADCHLPFHNIDAFNTMFDYTVNKNIDYIVILGDFMDCFDISNFEKEPDVIRFNDERNMAKDFLKELKKIYPNTKIYYKFGNHESRFEKYLIRKAPEIFGCEEFRLHVLLDLFNLGITYIPEEKYIQMQELSLLHGHEYKNGITSPANPARTTFLRTKSIALSAHNHQTSQHNEPRIDGFNISCWSIGCMCNIHPKYMPLNKWNNGFALHKRENDNFWFVNNHRIIKNRVV